MNAMKPAAGVTLQGKFVLERELGRGGMGTVWLARDRKLGREVAIKFLSVDDEATAGSPRAAELRERFEREARAAAQVRSRHVVLVHEFGFENDAPFLVMERLVGESLRDRIAGRARIAPDELVEVAHQLGRALDAAHAAGVIHRDVKPANVFLARDGAAEIVKVLDFGVARALGDPPPGVPTQAGQMLGSMHYMSPEQARSSRDAAPSSDLWSAAATLFHAVTGARPFGEGAGGDVLARLLVERPPAPSSIAPDLPPALDAFFATAFDRDPRRRFATGRLLAEAFERAVRGESGRAEPEHQHEHEHELDFADAATRVIDRPVGVFAPKPGLSGTLPLAAAPAAKAPSSASSNTPAGFVRVAATVPLPPGPQGPARPAPTPPPEHAPVSAPVTGSEADERPNALTLVALAVATAVVVLGIGALVIAMTRGPSPRPDPNGSTVRPEPTGARDP